MFKFWSEILLITLTFMVMVLGVRQVAPRYDPTWESIDSRPNPAWYDESKVGIFIHWGVFSVPSFTSEWFWTQWQNGGSAEVEFMRKNYPPGFTYQDFGPQFTAEFYDPAKWADLFQKAGARYVVLTSKHHEGYSLYPSKYSFSWNAMEVGPKRDLLGDLAAAIREKTDLRFGLYHSRYEWYNPLYMDDKAHDFHTDNFVQTKTLPELYEIVNKFLPDVVWSDGEWEAGDEYWKSLDFLAWLYNDSPVSATVVTNDRWGNTTRNKNGGFWTGSDRYNPGFLVPHKWENCMTLDRYSWGYRRNGQIGDYLGPAELMKELIETVSCGGNLLVNVGPTKEGVIVPIQEERLLQLGEWLGVNGNAIYESVPWTHQNDTVTPGIWYTSNPSRKQVYALVLNWPGQQPLLLGAVDPTTVDSVGLFGFNSDLTWVASPDAGLMVTFPRPDEVGSKWAWTIVINEK